MKKFTAFFSAFLILIMLVFTGCSSNSDSVGTAKPAPVKNTVSPTATVSLTLNDDTMYDESSFSIVIPKTANLTKNGPSYMWAITSDNYGVVVGIITSTIKTNVLTYVQSESSLNAVINQLEVSSNNVAKMDVGYTKLTVGSKSAVKLTGKYVSSPASKIDVYLIDSSEGMLAVTVIKIIKDNDSATITKAQTTADQIFSTLTVK